MNCRLVRRVMVIIILTVSLKPDSAFVSGPCALIGHEGTDDSQDGRQVVFNVKSIEEEGEMNCSNDDKKYSTNEMEEMALATFALIVTMNAGFGYAMGEMLILIPAGVHLDYFYRADRKGPALGPVQTGNIF